MKRLPKIRSGLARLRMFRSTVRLGMMGSTVLSILLWAMAGAFLLDFWIHMDQLERTIVLLGMIGVSLWAIVKYLKPALGVHESDTALAVMVDGMHGMHSDLVGAIQFDDDNRPQYGSEQLREAVVSNTAKAAGGMNFLEGFSRKELFKRLLMFVITVVICLTPAVVYAKYTGAFLKRMVLFETRYPTLTSIEVVSPALDGAHAEGDPVKFVVHAKHVSGPSQLPETGTVRIQADKTGLETVVELIREGGKDDVPAVYSGTLNRVLDDLSYTAYLGDDQSNLRHLKLVPRPRVTLDMEVIAPKYVHGKVPPKPKNQRQAIAVEGSKVIPVITCDNKDLDKGTITFEKSGKTYDLTRRGKSLVFDQDGSDLASVVEMVRFEINVIDTNNQKPESPIKGVVHIAADLPPRAALMGFSRYIVPGAAPELRYRAIDDYALDEITLHLALIDADGRQVDQPPISLVKLKGNRADYGGAYTLDMTKLKVQKGYQIAALIEVTDYRGELEGKFRRSEKWVFEITDNAGVLEAMDRLTEEMDKKLDEILRAQLEAGK
ncbi:MAG: hypothetical protein QGG25_13795 [Phycisphaerae bacterium]|nr:hypothetical protein [Phycisphaerae bacterium]